MTKKEKIEKDLLEIELRDALRYTYIHETHEISAYDGELHVGFGDDKWLVWNIDTLYKDLASIVSMVNRENDKQQNMYGDLLRDSLKENER